MTLPVCDTIQNGTIAFVDRKQKIDKLFDYD